MTNNVICGRPLPPGGVGGWGKSVSLVGGMVRVGLSAN